MARKNVVPHRLLPHKNKGFPFTLSAPFLRASHLLTAPYLHLLPGSRRERSACLTPQWADYFLLPSTFVSVCVVGFVYLFGFFVMFRSFHLSVLLELGRRCVKGVLPTGQVILKSRAE